MIFPRATDLVSCIEAELAHKIEPVLSDLAGLSAAATIKHLLRHIRVRIEREGAILTADIEALVKLLHAVKDYLGSANLPDGNAWTQEVEHALNPRRQAAEGYAGLDDLAARARELREAVYLALSRLVPLRASHGSDPAYREIRAAIRNYIVWQVEQEEQLIAPAFFGFGARR